MWFSVSTLAVGVETEHYKHAPFGSREPVSQSHCCYKHFRCKKSINVYNTSNDLVSVFLFLFTKQCYYHKYILQCLCIKSISSSRIFLSVPTHIQISLFEMILPFFDQPVEYTGPNISIWTATKGEPRRIVS